MKTPQPKAPEKQLTRDDILRRMLNTPPRPHETKPAKKAAMKRAAK